MSDETKNKGAINFRSILQQTKQTFEEAEAQIKAESFAKRSELFRMSGDGEYSVRILPLVPEIDAEGNVLPMDRHGFEYPVHQQFLKIELPKKKNEKKPKTISIPVVNATDKGVDKSIDLIDTYVKIAQEMYGDDDELMKLLESGSYNGGLKWSYIHAMYVFDLSKKGERRGPLVWNASHAQYCDIRDAKQRLWIKEREKDPERDCPVCGFENAYPVNIIRKTGNGNRTEYTIEIDRYTDDLTDEDLAKLFDAPRLPEQIYSFNRYSLEAEVEFLKQYDEKHDMEVCQEQDFLDAIETLKGELSPEDKSHFDINKSGEGKDGKDDGKGEITVNSLWAELDAIDDAGLSEKSDEYQELREKIRQFIEDNDLDIRLSRSKNNEALIRDIEEAMDDKEKNPSKSKKADDENDKEPEEKEDKSERRSRSRRAADDDEDDKEPEKKDEKDDEPEEKETRSRRRPRPSDDDEDDKEPEDKKPEKEDEPEEERPARRERRRR